jgi:hypothetical protein
MLDRGGDRGVGPRTRTRALAAALAGLAIAAVAFAGCGGGSSALTKAQYIQKVNALCANEKQAMRAVALQQIKPAVALDEAIKAREQADAEIAAVKLPSSGAISPEWLAQREAAVRALKRVSAIGFGKSRSRGPSPFFRANSRAEVIGKAYGLSECGGFAAS